MTFNMDFFQVNIPKWINHDKFMYFYYHSDDLMSIMFFRSEKNTSILRDHRTLSMSSRPGKNVPNDFVYEHAMAMFNEIMPGHSRMMQ